MTDFAQIWNQASAMLRDRLNADAYDRWFAGIVPVRIDEGNVAVLGVSNDIFSDWLANYNDVICETLEQVSGQVFTIKYEEGHEPQLLEDTESAVVEEPVEQPVTPVVKASVARDNDQFSQRFSFEEFVVGENNKFAYSACQAAAEAPGTAYNPLFIHSPSGLGKTHLLQAIGREVLKRNPNAVVEYVTTEDFSNQYVFALQHNSLPSFRNKIRNVDVLLVDDIQFLGTKSRFQEEFFYTFNALHNAHKQIVIASDRPPQELNGLESRLVSRFEWGLLADIQPPDLETRIAIIRKKQEPQEVKLPEDVINFLAAKIKLNIRRLEGALANLIMHAKFEKQTIITIDFAERVLENMLNEEATSALTVEQIQRVVAEHYDIRLADMTSKRRPASIALPRQVAMYLSRKMTDLSYPDIGEQFSKNHATILHAVSTIEERITSNQDFKREMAMLERKLRK